MQKNPRQDQTAVGTTNPNWIYIPTESNNVAASRNYPRGLFPLRSLETSDVGGGTGHEVRVL